MNDDNSIGVNRCVSEIVDKKLISMKSNKSLWKIGKCMYVYVMTNKLKKIEYKGLPSFLKCSWYYPGIDLAKSYLLKSSTMLSKYALSCS